MGIVGSRHAANGDGEQTASQKTRWEHDQSLQGLVGAGGAPSVARATGWEHRQAGIAEQPDGESGALGVLSVRSCNEPVGQQGVLLGVNANLPLLSR